MTQKLTPVAAPDQPVVAAGAGAGPSVGRIVGLDLARGLAVFGMYAVHVGPDPSEDGFGNRLVQLAEGRSSALFAVLAGVTLIIITGRRAATTSWASHRAAARIVTRSAVLVVLGTALTMLDTPAYVILANFGLYFLLALPLTRLTARALAVVAIGWALVGPQLLYLIVRAVYSSDFLATISGYWPLTTVADSATAYDSGWARTLAANNPLATLGGEGILELLVTGAYPALSWMPFLLAGMALARLDLASPAVRIRLAVLGPALAMLGYGGSWLAFRILPGIAAATGDPTAWWYGAENLSPAAQLVAAPHSQTTLSVIASTGVAITVIVAAVALTDQFRAVRRPAAPVITVGSMSLSAYVFHILVMAMLGDEKRESPLLVLLGLSISVTVLALIWKRHFRRGPLEYLVSTATKLEHPRRTVAILGGVTAALVAVAMIRPATTDPEHSSVDATGGSLDLSVTCTLDPRTPTPGVTAILTYTITSNSPAAVGMAADIHRKVDESDADTSYHIGLGDVASHQIQAGTNPPISRPIMIPANLPAGDYTVVGEVWPANRIDADAVDTYDDNDCAEFTVQ